MVSETECIAASDRRDLPIGPRDWVFVSPEGEDFQDTELELVELRPEEAEKSLELAEHQENEAIARAVEQGKRVGGLAISGATMQQRRQLPECRTSGSLTVMPSCGGGVVYAGETLSMGLRCHEGVYLMQAGRVAGRPHYVNTAGCHLYYLAVDREWVLNDEVNESSQDTGATTAPHLL